MLTNPKAKRILCYGDSNTWGQQPDAKARYAVGERWTSIVQQALGDGFEVIEEGLGSRTTDLNYDRKPGRNGKTYLQPCLESQNPLELVIIMLGTNDYKIEFDRSVTDIVAAIGSLVEDVAVYGRNTAGQPPRVAVVSPIFVDDTAPEFTTRYADVFYDHTAVEKSHAIARPLAELATKTGSFFADAAAVAAPGSDGIHLDKTGHKALGELLTRKIREWLS